MALVRVAGHRHGPDGRGPTGDRADRLLGEFVAQPSVCVSKRRPHAESDGLGHANEDAQPITDALRDAVSEPHAHEDALAIADPQRHTQPSCNAQSDPLDRCIAFADCDVVIVWEPVWVAEPIHLAVCFLFCIWFGYDDAFSGADAVA